MKTAQNYLKLFTNKKYLLGGLVIVSSFAIRIRGLSSRGIALNSDEATLLRESAFLASFGKTGWAVSELFNRPIHDAILALGMKIGTISDLTGLLTSVTLGTLTIGLVYLIGNKINKDLGIYSALILAISGAHIVYSRSAQSEATTAFFLTLSLWILLFDTKKIILKYLFLGLAFGLAAFSGPRAIPIVLILSVWVAIAEILIIIKDKNITGLVAKIFAYTIGFSLATFASWLVYYFSSQIIFTKSGSLLTNPANFLHALASSNSSYGINFVPSLNNLLIYPTMLAKFFDGYIPVILALLGIIIILAKINFKKATILIWFLIPLVFYSWYRASNLATPPAADRYIVVAIPAMAVLGGVAFQAIIKFIKLEAASTYILILTLFMGLYFQKNLLLPSTLNSIKEYGTSKGPFIWIDNYQASDEFPTVISNDLLAVKGIHDLDKLRQYYQAGFNAIIVRDVISSDEGRYSKNEELAKYLTGIPQAYTHIYNNKRATSILFLSRGFGDGPGSWKNYSAASAVRDRIWDLTQVFKDTPRNILVANQKNLEIEAENFVEIPSSFPKQFNSINDQDASGGTLLASTGGEELATFVHFEAGRYTLLVRVKDFRDFANTGFAVIGNSQKIISWGQDTPKFEWLVGPTIETKESIQKVSITAQTADFIKQQSFAIDKIAIIRGDKVDAEKYINEN